MVTSAATVTLTDVALFLAALPLFALGWLAGVIVRITLWIVAAIVAGYREGMGQ